MFRPSYGKNDGIFSLNLDIHVLSLSFLFHARVLKTLFHKKSQFSRSGERPRQN